MSRISNPHTGTGNLGRSHLISGHRIRKSSSICALQNELMFFNNAFVRYLITLGTSEAEHRYREITDKIIYEISNNLTASAYFKFQNDKYTIPHSFLFDLNTAIEELTDIHVDCPEFFVPTHNLALLGDSATTQCRKAEHHFWVCVEDIYNQYDMQDQEPRENMVVATTGKYLNMLSDFLFLHYRASHFDLGKESRYWQNS